ncbi:MAG: polysaccharide biosynthesis protein [Candidatus Cloacimonetes bacterium]|nr:polysaccharide biosynthesis protein [Candidatus Cloacimonadota bacterium]
MSKLSRQAGLLTAADFFRFFLKSLIGIALARLITPGELGTYRQLFLIYTTFSTLLMLGIPQSLLYFLPKAPDEKSQKALIARTLNIVSLLALLFALAMILFRHEVAFRFANPQIDKLLLLFAVYPVFMLITQLYSSVMLGLKQTARAAKFMLFAIGCDFFLILGTALFTRNLYSIVVAVIISAFLQWIYAQVQLRKYHALFDGSIYSGLKEQLGYAIPLGLASIIGMLSMQLDKFMISGFFTPEQFAVFSIGAMELPLVGILSNSVNSVLLPHLSSSDPRAMSELYCGAVRKNTLIIFPLTALFFIFAEPMMIFLYGQIYAEAAVYFRIYLLILPLRIATYGILFQACGKTKLIMVISVITLLSNAVLNFFMIRAWGMQGAAYATVTVTWLSVLLYLLLMHQSLKLKLSALFPIGKIVRTALVTIISGALVYALFTVLSSTLLQIVLGSGLFMLGYIFLGRLGGVILDCDLAFIRSIIADLIRLRKR